jgi:hypothetical protein
MEEGINVEVWRTWFQHESHAKVKGLIVRI